ncbi:uncharacterized protein HMPREF1541_09776 [Cyphellophora europaea CBS 101466]|uniref:J domain-containing protein n=1 Tax=Cyphellophora europaea (strain CBS 101466) TaxID=1220924 RepID=W2S887_CYPE1|nr:uncharacterized protein HMPREF1541_09776 [Cyphellophora europaea CBS 101466]ETN44901.1 hypothetical protein HMPREF1541_09776 [Cyphellophora europaea CBS 101466]
MERLEFVRQASIGKAKTLVRLALAYISLPKKLPFEYAFVKFQYPAGWYMEWLERFLPYTEWDILCWHGECHFYNWQDSFFPRTLMKANMQAQTAKAFYQSLWMRNELVIRTVALPLLALVAFIVLVWALVCVLELVTCLIRLLDQGLSMLIRKLAAPVLAAVQGSIAGFFATIKFMVMVFKILLVYPFFAASGIVYLVYVSYVSLDILLQGCKALRDLMTNFVMLTTQTFLETLEEIRSKLESGTAEDVLDNGVDPTSETHPEPTTTPTIITITTNQRSAATATASKLEADTIHITAGKNYSSGQGGRRRFSVRSPGVSNNLGATSGEDLHATPFHNPRFAERESPIRTEAPNNRKPHTTETSAQVPTEHKIPEASVKSTEDKPCPESVSDFGTTAAYPRDSYKQNTEKVSRRPVTKETESKSECDKLATSSTATPRDRTREDRTAPASRPKVNPDARPRGHRKARPESMADLGDGADIFRKYSEAQKSKKSPPRGPKCSSRSGFPDDKAGKPPQPEVKPQENTRSAYEKQESKGKGAAFSDFMKNMIDEANSYRQQTFAQPQAKREDTRSAYEEPQSTNRETWFESIVDSIINDDKSTQRQAPPQAQPREQPKPKSDYVRQGYQAYNPSNSGPQPRTQSQHRESYRKPHVEERPPPQQYQPYSPPRRDHTRRSDTRPKATSYRLSQTYAEREAESRYYSPDGFKREPGWSSSGGAYSFGGSRSTNTGGSRSTNTGAYSNHNNERSASFDFNFGNDANFNFQFGGGGGGSSSNSNAHYAGSHHRRPPTPVEEEEYDTTPPRFDYSRHHHFPSAPPPAPEPPVFNPYQVLNLARTANFSQIKKAYHKLSLQHHPDKNKGKFRSEAQRAAGEEKMKAVNRAKALLEDPVRRWVYHHRGLQDAEHDPLVDAVRRDERFQAGEAVMDGWFVAGIW